jgi:hypothetical protein
MFASFTSLERLVARVVLAEGFLVVSLVLVVAGSRIYNLWSERRRSAAAAALTRWFSQALLGEPAESPLPLFAKLSRRRARLLLAEQAERVVPQERPPLRELYLKLGLNQRHQHPPLWEKLVAIRDARAFNDPAKDLASYLKDPLFDVRLSAFEVMIELGRVEEALAAIPQLSSESTSSRLRIIDALFNTPLSLERLLDLMKKPGECRRVAVALLGRTHADAAMEELVKALGDTDREVRIHALRAIRTSGNPARVEACVPLLQDPEWQVRSESVRTLASLGGERFATPIGALLRDPAEWVRHHAARALLLCGATGAGLLQTAAAEGVRAAATAVALAPTKVGMAARSRETAS